MGVVNFRTLTGHDYLRKHLHRFGLSDSLICPLCLTDSDMSGNQLNYYPGLIDVVAANVAMNFNHFVCISELY